MSKCKDCGQPMLPKGNVKKTNEYDHAQGCPSARNPRVDPAGVALLDEIKRLRKVEEAARVAYSQFREFDGDRFRLENPGAGIAIDALRKALGGR